MRISDCIEANLHKLDNVFINTNPETRLGQKIDKLNRDIQKCSCEVNGQDWDGDVNQFHNPFPDKPVTYQSNGSLADLQAQGIPLVWKTFDESLHLELIL